jgi:hypothetical protein
MSHDEKNYYADDKNESLEKGGYHAQAPIDEKDPRYHFDPHDLGTWLQ